LFHRKIRFTYFTLHSRLREAVYQFCYSLVENHQQSAMAVDKGVSINTRSTRKRAINYNASYGAFDGVQYPRPVPFRRGVARRDASRYLVLASTVGVMPAQFHFLSFLEFHGVAYRPERPCGSFSLLRAFVYFTKNVFLRLVKRSRLSKLHQCACVPMASSDTESKLVVTIH